MRRYEDCGKWCGGKYSRAGFNARKERKIAERRRDVYRRMRMFDVADVDKLNLK